MRILVALLTLAPFIADAGMVTIEPDRYAAGTNLSEVSPYATLEVTGGGAVYAGNISPNFREGMFTTGPLGRRVFTTDLWRGPDGWFAQTISHEPSYYDTFDKWLTDDASGALAVTFNRPVDFVSILQAEYAPDAGGTGQDPAQWFFYDWNDQLIHYEAWWLNAQQDDYDVDRYVLAYNGFDFHYGALAFPVYGAAYSNPNIHRVVIGGESEPTVIDRLRFRVIDVPEPSTMGLFGVALGMLALRRRSWKANRTGSSRGTLRTVDAVAASRRAISCG